MRLALLLSALSFVASYGLFILALVYGWIWVDSTGIGFMIPNQGGYFYAFQ